MKFKVYIGKDLVFESEERMEAYNLFVDEYKKACEFHENKGMTYGFSSVGTEENKKYMAYTTHRQDVNHMITVTFAEE